MDFFIVEKSPRVDRDYVFLEDTPEGIGIYKHKLSRGEPMGDLYPGPEEMKWYMDRDNPGIKLPSLIGNFKNVVIVDKAMKDVVEATGVSMECLNFTLYNHKKRVASRDYFVINVLGTFDCLNHDESVIKYSEKHPDEVIDVKRAVFDSRKLKDAPDIFRVKEEHVTIVISHRLADALKKINPTNVYLHKVEQAP